ncbi:hypothetical protein [Pseudostreptobacillus hongkongensis]|uniref:hypothetical protein n=1 Tax=Pseudostreptobacillus hongkongensis TaxID=1162717 RepID=UPI00082CD986|nr:hypothetical protein [Pseudostreptobacillus hongkongensis]
MLTRFMLGTIILTLIVVLGSSTPVGVVLWILGFISLCISVVLFLGTFEEDPTFKYGKGNK